MPVRGRPGVPGVWIAAVFGLATAVFATDRYVSASGTDTAPYTNWHTAAHSIQSAVDASSGGDVVWVTNGTYALTSEILVDKAVTVRSINPASRPVTINGGAANRCFYLSHSGALVAGFVITNGYSDEFGGGIEIDNGGTVSNCLITGNRVAVDLPTSYGGGGVDCYLNAQLLNCDIVGNTAEGTNFPTGGGVLCQGGGVVVRQCTIDRNRVISAATNGLGGGLQCVDAAAVERCFIRGNTVQGIGGGVACDGLNGGVSISDCTIATNSATLMGGGFVIQTGEVSVVQRCVVQANTTDGVGGGGYVRVNGIVLDSLVAGNHAGDTTVTNAGGLFLRRGGGATNCTVAGNTSAGGSGGVYLDDSDGTQPRVTACIVYSNAPENYKWTQQIGHFIEYSCLSPESSLFNGSGNITNAPLWRAAGDYHLRPDSPCIDLAPTGNSSDIEGLVRPMDGNFDGLSWYDAGCYEFSTNQDTDANGLPDGWEYRYFGVFTGTLANVDTDGDTVTNLVEYQQGSHPRDDTSGTPYVGESGLPSGWLLKYELSVSTPDPDGDADGDGVSNIGEMIAGTNPRDIDSYPAFWVARTNGRPALHWLSAPRRIYTVLQSTNLLAQAAFSEMQTGLTGPQWPSTNDLTFSATTNKFFNRLSITRP